ncbi:MAG: hypothetical protein ABJD68_02760 [Nakamurella sp.]
MAVTDEATLGGLAVLGPVVIDSTATGELLVGAVAVVRIRAAAAAASVDTGVLGVGVIVVRAISWVPVRLDGSSTCCDAGAESIDGCG